MNPKKSHWSDRRQSPIQMKRSKTSNGLLASFVLAIFDILIKIYTDNQDLHKPVLNRAQCSIKIIFVNNVLTIFDIFFYK